MLRAWWQERPPRERWALIIGGAALMLTAIYLVIEPVIQERRRLAAEIPQLRQDLAWMRGQLATIERLGGAGGTAATTGQGPLTPALIQEAVNRAGLGEQLGGLRTAGEGRIRLAFDQVAFARVMELLRDLRNRGGARVSAARIQALADQPGMVQAQLTLRGDTPS